MTELSESVSRMIREFEKLPGLGKKSAERIAYHLLKLETPEALALADSIRAVKENVRYCKHCFNLTEHELCEICNDPRRNQTLLCVVEQPQDLIRLEQTGRYDGLYHVLLGRLAPLDKITPDQLTIAALVERIRDGAFTEIVMGTNPTVEGDSTAYYIIGQLESLPNKPKITRLARGISTGSDLQFVNAEMLADALSERQAMR
ncbi:MAG: recombination mediator RecR [Planctomycetaceae bacterium]|jgi:recombination protein RecR|nr:recombination mediator RecR [Planctomycetaceae bacterium]